ncbi:adenylate kinase [Mucilaginibacter sp.]|jgi:adenylate kinase family enzyme|uniref:adenylate kinase n=1 Tax=Mucilaginibacter sp. TaxID=1882438 RepID=UPI0035677392
MKIHIMGASCAGSTTLGNALAEQLSIPYFDTDDYFWEPSDVPYTIRRDTDKRNNMLKSDLAKNKDYILGGSLISWGNEWKEMFDLVVFLYVPQEIRIKRLMAREVQRYGDTIHTDPERALLYKDFIAWATKYDDRTFSGRNIQVHEDWLHDLQCKALEIREDTTVKERIALVKDQIDKLEAAGLFD